MSAIADDAAVSVVADAAAVEAVADDAAMDAVQRRLMFEDENAAQRKLFDELGIPAEALPVDRFTPLGRMLYKAPSDGKWGEHELDYLLFVVADVKLLPNPDEVADVRYVNREQLKELLEKADAGEEGVKLSPWFRLVVDNFLLKWWDCVESGTLPE
ncbi:isopentenyl-diphosphate Delta-isomerase, partial [Musa troglodytarum]